MCVMEKIGDSFFEKMMEEIYFSKGWNKIDFEKVYKKTNYYKKERDIYNFLIQKLNILKVCKTVCKERKDKNGKDGKII